MWKRLGRRFGRSSGASTSRSVASSVSDLRGKFFLEKHCTHGFPLSPSCMTFDPYRRVLFIGNTSGELRMLGRPGVELTGLHNDIGKVLQILPFSTEPSVITVCSNNLLHKWSLVDETGSAKLTLRKTYKFQGGLAKTITVCALPSYCECLFVGTLGGITYPIDTEFDGMSPEVLSWTRSRAYLKYKGKDVPGKVCALEINPANPKKLLIAYEHNYLELWDSISWKPLAIFGPFKEEDVGELMSTCWHSSGQRFVTSHRDGTIAFWGLEHLNQPYQFKKLHGTERCQEISSILWASDTMQVMYGGAPLDQVDGDSVTIADGDEVVTLQLTSGVRGMHLLEDTQADRDSGIVNAGYDAASENSTTVRKILVLLLEQEIIFIYLRLPELPLLPSPYLHSMHNSPLKALQLVSSVDRELMSAIGKIGRYQQEAIYRAPAKTWPIDGGKLHQGWSHDRRDLFITGHEDSSVKLWDVSDVSMRLMHTFRCSPYFNSLESDFQHAATRDIDTRDSDSPDVVSPPRIRQIGFWDPRSDDEQLIVTAVHFAGDQLAIGLQGGVVLLLRINYQSANVTIELVRVSILRDDPRQRGRTWQAPLDVRLGNLECAPGYQPTHCINLFPNVAVTTISIVREHCLVGIGCIYGFTVVDYHKNAIVHVQSTYDAVLNAEPANMSRMQSIRRSFRQSLKRLNVRRSMRGMQSTQRSYRPDLVRSGSSRPSRRGGAGASAFPTGAVGGGEPAPLRRDTVRTIAFTAPCHVAGHASVHHVLVGTTNGGVLAYTLDMPSSKHRDTRSPIMMPIDKEFSVKKNNATLFVGVVDGHSYLLDINDRGSYHPKGSHYLVVCTEEIIRVVGVPTQKKKYRVKVKQNDEDDLHIISANFIRVSGQSGLATIDSEGFLSIYSLPDLRLISKSDCVDATDAIGQRNFVCSSIGVILFQRSPSEFIHASVTEEARMELHFDIPERHDLDPLPLSPTVALPGDDPFESFDHPTTPSDVSSPIKSVSGTPAPGQTGEGLPTSPPSSEVSFQERAL